MLYMILLHYYFFSLLNVAFFLFLFPDIMTLTTLHALSAYFFLLFVHNRIRGVVSE